MCFMRKVICFLVLMLFSRVVTAQKIHAFIFCNTEDKSIGASAEKNLQHMVDFTERLSVGLDYKIVSHVVFGKDFNRQTILRTIDEGMSEVTKLDVIVVYFNTHGYKAVGSVDSFPQLVIGNDLISSLDVHTQICKVDHRLLLTLIDACSEYKQLEPQDSFLLKTTFTQSTNKIISELRSSKLNNYNFRGYFDRQGSFIVSAGQAGSLTWASSDGSFFTTNFIKAFYEAVDTSNYLIDWSSLLNKAARYTFEITKDYPTKPFRFGHSSNVVHRQR